MSNIKITYLVDFFRTINAGTEKQLGHLLTHLPEIGYCVQLISLQDSLFLKNEAPSIFPKVTIKTLGAQSDISKSLPSLARLFGLLRISRPDVVHTFFPASNSFGVLVARAAGIRTVISSRRDMGYNLTRTDITLLKIANRFVSCVVTNSKAVQEHTIQIEAIPTRKTRVIYNGISLHGPSRSPKKIRPRQPVVGIVANLNRPVKRVDLFLKAASVIHKEFPNTRFWIVGDGPLRASLETLALSFSLNSSVVFMGRRRNVKDLLEETTVGIVCSDSEGLSNAIMEYMSAGVPVVATNVGGNPELVDNERTGFLVPPSDYRALSAAIMKVLKEHPLAKHMGMLAKQKTASQFSMRKMIHSMESLYTQMTSLGHHGHRNH